MGARVMIMAGGTGGHVFPALAVARLLRERGMEVFWLGTRNGLEARVVPEAGFAMEWVDVQGLRGTGIQRLLKAPFMVALAMVHCFKILRRRRPQLVLGMGGFVTGPAGVVSWLLGIPLMVHEQNAVPGLTNRWLSHIASRVLEAFPGSFEAKVRAQAVGNPVRADITALEEPAKRMAGRKLPIRLLVVGGSLGAQVLNDTVPTALALLGPEMCPEILHQAGKDKDEMTRAAYEQAGVSADVRPFVTDMAEAYGWADLVVCRSGALTVSELAAAGVGAVLVPYPHAVDDHQTCNAAFLCDAGAARLLPQQELNAERLAEMFRELLSDRGCLLAMAEHARSLAEPQAAEAVADLCQEGVQ